MPPGRSRRSGSPFPRLTWQGPFPATATCLDARSTRPVAGRSRRSRTTVPRLTWQGPFPATAACLRARPRVWLLASPARFTVGRLAAPRCVAGPAGRELATEHKNTERAATPIRLPLKREQTAAPLPAPSSEGAVRRSLTQGATEVLQRSPPFRPHCTKQAVLFRAKGACVYAAPSVCPSGSQLPLKGGAFWNRPPSGAAALRTQKSTAAVIPLRCPIQ